MKQSRDALRVVILGRPNVGKSTLFNRIIGKKRALVHDIPGVTRDRIEENLEMRWGGKVVPLLMIDTGGMDAQGAQFGPEIERQVKIALEGADLALWVVDAQTGIMPQDEDLLQRLTQSGLLNQVPFCVIVNKVDDQKHEERGAEFYSLGIERVFTASAEHGRGLDDIRDLLAERAAELGKSFAQVDEEDEKLSKAEDKSERAANGVVEEELSEEQIEAEDREFKRANRPIRIAIVGKPNVGKSTLVNALLGNERMITSPIAGTTTDAVDVEVFLGEKKYLLVDTAGLRRKNKTEQGVEVLSVVQTRKAIENADVAILVLDGEEGISDQDEKIAGLVEEMGASVILAMNKWDVQRNNPKFTRDLAAERIRDQIRFLSYAPIIFMSAKYGKGLEGLSELIEEIMHQRRLKLNTHEFTEWIRQESTIHNPANARFFLCHQTGRNPPSFVIHVNDPDKVHFSLRRHFVNAMRERWGFMGTPIELHFIEGKNRRSLPKPKREAKFARSVKVGEKKGKNARSPSKKNATSNRKKHTA